MFGTALKDLAEALNNSALWQIVDILSALFIMGIGCVALAIVALYVIDSTQTKHAVRRNYPVIGRFRYIFEALGEYFRQYFFAMDREELPFNRAQRAWVYRAAKGVDTTVAFGSTRDLRPAGTVTVRNWPFPPAGKERRRHGHRRNRSLCAHALPHRIDLQYFRHELWRDL